VRVRGYALPVLSQISDLRFEIRKPLTYLLQDDKSSPAGAYDDNGRDDVPRNQFSFTSRAAGPGPAGPPATGWTLHTVIPESRFLKD